MAFSSRARILGECSTIYSPPALFSSSSFCFCRWRLAGAHLLHSFGRDQSTVAQGGETTDRVFSDELRVSSFPDRFPHYACTAAWSAHSDFVVSRVYACLGVTCHQHFWQNDRGLLRAIAVTRGWNGHRIRVSAES